MSNENTPDLATSEEAAPALPNITVEDRCEMCKFAMHDLIATFKNDFAITDEEFEELQDKVKHTLEALRPTEQEMMEMPTEQSVHRYGITLAHYALLVYCAAGTMKNALEFSEPLKEAAKNIQEAKEHIEVPNE